MKRAILSLTFVSLLSPAVMAAALCPPNSCNPHNGCIDGCPPGGDGDGSLRDLTFIKLLQSEIKSVKADQKQSPLACNN